MIFIAYSGSYIYMGARVQE